ncbi:MAG TPA: ATP-binding protein [Jatrophihabitantaceae bacterium]|nr:ATP-binding protein [Jatrophihabitantaceae bacterium]
MLGLALALIVIAVLLAAAAARVLYTARRAQEAPPPDADAPRRPPHLPALASLVVEALDIGVVVVDAEERVVLINPAARAMDVVDVDRLAFEPLRAIASDARRDDASLCRAIDLPLSRLGREPIAVAATAVPVTDADRSDGVALLLADISEQRRLDEVRRDFVANVSHELKTPVGALSLLAEAVRDAAGDAEAVERFAGRMQHESARLGRLVSELMELSKVQGVDPMPGATEVDVEQLVADAVDRERLAAEQAGIEIDVRCEPGLRVRGNDAQLAAAVSNLVDNAIAYSQAGSRVVVVAKSASDHQARPTVDIAVTDQGIGVSAADQERIFERFYRVDPARSRATGGTGLGLAIVKNVVTNHRGTVIVRSTPGEGSTFTVRLPRVHSDGGSSPS